MIPLKLALEEYLKLRRALGWELVLPEAALRQFVAYAGRAGAARVTADVAVRWAIEGSAGSPPMWSRRLMFVRKFAEYLHGLDPRTEIPSPDLLPHRFRRHRPYIYTDDEVAALVAAARTFPDWSALERATISTLFGLLASTGLRGCEAYRLDQGDVDLERGLLTVHRTKFRKSRLVLLHPTVRNKLKRYAQVRDLQCGRPAAGAFLVDGEKHRLTRYHARRRLVQSCAHIGIRRPDDPTGPRIHDLRHTFIVRTVLRWYRARVDVGARLPALSTYVGHNQVASTYWYLTGVPELLAVAGSRLERALRGMP